MTGSRWNQLTSVSNVTTSIVTTLLALFAPAAWAQPAWRQFRGPDSQGIAVADVKSPTSLDPDANRLWRCELPPGHSSPCIWGDVIYVTGCEERQLQTIAIRRSTGEILWNRSVDVETTEKTHPINGPASPTPTCDGQRVYVYFGSYGLICYDLEGNRVWERRLERLPNMFGTAASPILVDDALIFCCDNSESSYLELIDCETGQTRWKQPREGFGSGWSSPVIWQRDGRSEIVVYGVFELTGYSLEDGTRLWSVPGLADEPCITPARSDELIYVTSYNMKTNPEVIGLPTFDELLAKHDHNQDGKLSQEEASENKSVLSRFDADGEGDHPLSLFFRFLDVDRDAQIEPEEWGKIIAWVDGFSQENALVAIRHDAESPTGASIVWRQESGVPECPSPLLYRGRIYLVKNGGIVTCVNAESGQKVFQKRLKAGGPYYASPVVCGDVVYVASARGVVTALAARDQLQVI